jgi:hypothetical protein
MTDYSDFLSDRQKVEVDRLVARALALTCTVCGLPVLTTRIELARHVCWVCKRIAASVAAEAREIREAWKQYD